MDFDSIKEDLNLRYPNIRVLDIKDAGSGSIDMELAVGSKELAYLQASGPIPALRPRDSAALSEIRRQPLDRSVLDNVQKAIVDSTPQECFQRSIDYCRTKDIYGTVIRSLSNFSSKGFENDMDDDNIKGFFDNWGVDTGLDAIVEQIFYDFFRVGMVRTYKTLGKYVPGINVYSAVPPGTSSNKAAREKAAKKNRWSKSQLPIRYTILNPLMIELKGSMFFDKPAVYLKAEALKDLKELLDKKGSELSADEKKFLEGVPADMRKAARDGSSYKLNPSLVGEIDYRRQPYERYPFPRGTNAFESIDYKDELRKADLSTLDGISNYILLITVGNDSFPVQNQVVLENVAEMFNTPSKAFNIVWNHTLEIKKIVSPEIDAILGPVKYEQVNEDYTGALGFVRALIDGGGGISSAAASLAIKSIIAEVDYARRQVRRWLYNEYRQVAEVMGFDRYPVVRFSDIDLRDEIAMMRVLQGMIDRRIMSYETGIKRLGLDAETEMSRLAREKDMVLRGDLGIIGSPYNPKAAPPLSTNVQDTQKTPTGTPSEGRPPGTGDGVTPVRPPQNASVEDILDQIDQLFDSDVEALLDRLKERAE